MSTISLYAKQTNAMPGLFETLRKAENKLKTEIADIKKKILAVDSGVCNLSDTLQKITASTAIIEDRVQDLEDLKEETQAFIDDTVKIDEKVGTLVDKNKDDFYKKYAYLKPDSEKSVWEKICDKFEGAVEWCKKNTVAIITAVVVVAIACVAALCSVALSVIAAVAGIIAFVLFAVDIICMICTGKSMADYCTEKGMPILGQIFKGLSWGCDIVSILIPAGSLIKSCVKIGGKETLIAMKEGFKIGFREFCEELGEKGFKKGFGQGMKNIFKMGFKTFIFDVDDLYTVTKGSRTFSLMDDALEATNPGKYWVKDGNSLVPTDAIPKNHNPEGKTMKELLAQFNDRNTGLPLERIPLDRKGRADMSVVSVVDVDVNMRNLADRGKTTQYNTETLIKEFNESMNGTRVTKYNANGKPITVNTEFGDNLRKTNLKQADLNLSEHLKKFDFDQATIDSLKGKKAYELALEKNLGLELIPHESWDLRTVNYVPAAIHENLKHSGGISRTKLEIIKAFRMTKIAIREIPDIGFRHGIFNFVESKYQTP